MPIVVRLIVNLKGAESRVSMPMSSGYVQNRCEDDLFIY